MRHRQRRGPRVKAAGNSDSPTSRSSSGLGAKVRPGSESAAQARVGSPGTWETSSSPCATSDGGAGYCRAKATKWSRTDGEESQQRVVPTKRGKSPERPRGGKALPGHGTDRRNDGRDIE